MQTFGSKRNCMLNCNVPIHLMLNFGLFLFIQYKISKGNNINLFGQGPSII